MPIWMAFAVLAAVWLLRSVVRGDYGLDLPDDLVALSAVSIAALVVWLTRRADAGDDRHGDDSQDEEHREDGGTDEHRDPDEV